MALPDGASAYMQIDVLKALTPGLDLRTLRFLVAKRFALLADAPEQLTFADAKALFRSIVLEQSHRAVRAKA